MTNIQKYLSGCYTPIKEEVAAEKLFITGKIPKDLKGIFLRNGPNPQHMPKQRYHLFDGDGMLHGLYFNQGEVYYRNQWIKTERWNIEAKFGKSIFGGLLDYQQGKLKFNTVNRAFNTSNTNFIWHHGKCHSLWEFGHPYEINPHDLTTRGLSPISKSIQGAFTAHPKIDPITGELLGISYNGAFEFPACTLHRFDVDGKMKEFRKLDVPYRSMIHDFAFTKNYFIIPVLPTVVDFSGTASQLLQWSPENEAHIGITLRRAGNQSIVWFTLPTCYVYHFSNAFEEGKCVIVDAVVHEHAPLFTLDQNGNSVDPTQARLMRWKFNLLEQSFAQIPLDFPTCHYYFPVCDSRFISKKYQILFASAEENGHQLIRLNLKTHEKLAYFTQGDTTLSEPIFIPRQKNAKEGDGYLACLASSFSQNKTELLFFDSDDLNEPMAKACLPHYVPFGFHGLWIPNIMINV